MAEMTFVIGGTRSGKSTIAEQIASTSPSLVYIVTCIPVDQELKDRVERHQVRRPPHWRTIVEPLEPAAAVASLKGDETVFIECLSFLVFNWMELQKSDAEIIDSTVKLMEALRTHGARTIIVSNDVSESLIAPDHWTRRYQDLLGRVNQIAAARADRVILSVAGLPVTIKG